MSILVENSQEIANKKPGRPLKFANPEILKEKIDNYFQKAEETGEPQTMTGLAVHLDILLQTLSDYEKYSVEFSDVIQKARQKILKYAENNLLKTGTNTTGTIFYLKNRFGFCDKVENVSKNLNIDMNYETFINRARGDEF